MALPALAACAPHAGLTSASVSTWRNELRRTYDGSYFSDVSNLFVPQGSNLGLCLSARISDLTGDGNPDIVSAIHYGTNRIFVNPGDGHRLRDETLARLPQVDRASEEMLARDVDGDGDIDLVITNAASNGNALLINDGSGHFTDHSDWLPGYSMTGLAAADIAGNGRVDLVVGTDHGVAVLINDGHGRFADESNRRIPHFEDKVSGVTLSDLRGSGKVDLVVAGELGIRLFFNDGSGHFLAAPAGAIPAARWPEETWKIAAGDVNADGYPDLFLANIFFRRADAVLRNRLLINDGHGGFRDETAQRLPRETDGLSTHIGRFVSLGNDGVLDLVLGTFRDDVYGRRHDTPWKAYINDGRGYFRDMTSQVLPRTATGNGRFVDAGDFNRDGLVDLYLCSRGGPSLLLVGRQNAPSLRRRDIDQIYH
jgi:hypothetical protein